MTLRETRLDGMSIQSRVIAEMRERIISGELDPGTSLSEVALAEAFKVSRTPVREALKQLQTEGLVEVRPRVGTFVTTPSRREITDLFQLKEVLEGAAARFLAQRGRCAELDELHRNLVEADAAVAAGQKERYAELVHEFHDLLIAGADNAKFESHYRILMNQLAYQRLVHTSLRPAGSGNPVRFRAPPGGRPHRSQGRRERGAGHARTRPRQLPRGHGRTRTRRPADASGSRHRPPLPGAVSGRQRVPSWPGRRRGCASRPCPRRSAPTRGCSCAG